MPRRFAARGAAGDASLFFYLPWRGRSPREARGVGVTAATLSHQLRSALGAAHLTPRPSGATLPLQGRVETQVLAFSRRVFLRPSLGKPLHESVCLQINKGRRS